MTFKQFLEQFQHHWEDRDINISDLEKAFNEAYNAGFQKGFESGYEDGFIEARGFEVFDEY